MILRLSLSLNNLQESPVCQPFPLMLEVNPESSAPVEFALDIDFSAQRDDLCFYQVQAQSLPFHMRMEPLVKCKHILFVLAKINPKTIVCNDQTNELLINCCLQIDEWLPRWIPVLEGIAYQVI